MIRHLTGVINTSAAVVGQELPADVQSLENSRFEAWDSGTDALVRMFQGEKLIGETSLRDDTMVSAQFEDGRASARIDRGVEIGPARDQVLTPFYVPTDVLAEMRPTGHSADPAGAEYQSENGLASCRLVVNEATGLVLLLTLGDLEPGGASLLTRMVYETDGEVGSIPDATPLGEGPDGEPPYIEQYDLRLAAAAEAFGLPDLPDVEGFIRSGQMSYECPTAYQGHAWYETPDGRKVTVQAYGLSPLGSPNSFDLSVYRDNDGLHAAAEVDDGGFEVLGTELDDVMAVVYGFCAGHQINLRGVGQVEPRLN